MSAYMQEQIKLGRPGTSTTVRESKRPRNVSSRFLSRVLAPRMLSPRPLQRTSQRRARQRRVRMGGRRKRRKVVSPLAYLDARTRRRVASHPSRTAVQRLRMLGNQIQRILLSRLALIHIPMSPTQHHSLTLDAIVSHPPLDDHSLSSSEARCRPHHCKDNRQFPKAHRLQPRRSLRLSSPSRYCANAISNSRLCTRSTSSAHLLLRQSNHHMQRRQLRW